MSTNLNSPIPSPRTVSGESWAAIAGAVGSAFLLAKKLLGPRAAKPEPMSRADFYAEALASRERIHANHVALLVFAAAARHLRYRDRWIGWTDAQRERRLSLISINLMDHKFFESL